MNQGAQKKGLHPLAWVGIGCGVITLLIIIVVIVGGIFAVNKVKDVAGDFESNPELAGARIFIKMNPEIEEVSYDEDAGTITVREKETGEVVTVKYDEISDGKISFESEDGETASFEAGQSDDEGVKITTDDGSITLNANVEDVPTWVPMAKCMTVTGHSKMDMAETSSGSIMGSSSKTVKDTITEFKQLIEKAGFKVEEQSMETEEGPIGLLMGFDEKDDSTIKVSAGSEDNKIVVSVVYSKKK